jgi:alpha-beta hydrolase superfamily lysophospholipase
MRTPLTPPEFRSWKVSDGAELRGRLWPPQAVPAPWAILYLHGIQSHGGWFAWSASLLARGGVPVLLADRRGSGLNAAARGDTPAAARWLADLDELADWAAHEWGVQHFAVVGVSWGGKLACAWAVRRPQRAARLLLIAPGLFPAVDVELLTRLRIGAALLRSPQRAFPIPLDDPALFTDNPAGRTFIADDSLKLTHATARFLYESTRLDRALRRAAPGSLPADTTLLLAARDRIIRNAPTIAWLQRTAAQSPTVHTLAAAAHTLEFEADVGPFAQLLRHWARP